AYYGRTIYTSFGLEGVNNVAGATSREQLLRTFLNWANDKPTATISQTLAGGNSKLVGFEATVTSPITGTAGLTYRWDFGDGSAFARPFSTPQASHSYTYCGLYRVRVEATDSFGNRTIGELRVHVQSACSARLLLPLQRR